MLTRAEATTSMAPLVQFGKKLESEGVVGVVVRQLEFTSWGKLWNALSDTDAAVSQKLPLSYTLMTISERVVLPETWHPTRSRISSHPVVQPPHSALPQNSPLFPPHRSNTYPRSPSPCQYPF